MGSVSACVLYAGDGFLYVRLPAVLAKVEVEPRDVGVGHETDLDMPGVDGKEGDDVLDELKLFPEVTTPDAVRRVQYEDDICRISDTLYDISIRTV